MVFGFKWGTDTQTPPNFSEETLQIWDTGNPTKNNWSLYVLEVPNKRFNKSTKMKGFRKFQKKHINLVTNDEKSLHHPWWLASRNLHCSWGVHAPEISFQDLSNHLFKVCRTCFTIFCGLLFFFLILILKPLSQQS